MRGLLRLSELFKRSQLRKLSCVLLCAVCCFCGCLTPSIAYATSPLLSGYVALKETAAESIPFEQAIAESKPLLVEFYADWCSVCRGMAPLMADLKESYGDDVNFVMLDIDDPRWDEEVDRFRVPGVPYYAFIGAPEEPESQGIGDRPLLRTLVGRHPSVVMSRTLDSLLDAG